MVEKKGKGDYFTVEEVAEIVGVSVPTVYRWIKKKLIVATTYGMNRKLVSRFELKRFVGQYNYGFK